MNIHDIKIPHIPGETVRPQVDERLHPLSALTRLADSPDGVVDAVDGCGRPCGSLGAVELVRAAAASFPLAPGASLIEAECDVEQYSASGVARAVEDADVQMLGLWTRPAGASDPSKVKFLIMTGAHDPSGAEHSLQRYGFTVTETFADDAPDYSTALERLGALQMYLKV